MSEHQKKLLILGGTRISLQILEAAKKMGLAVFVADYNEDSPCKQIADKSFMVSATDVNAVTEIIHKEKIDGVLMGYADVLLNAYVDICQSAGLPCYATHKSIDITANKREFKNFCRVHGVPVVDEYSFEDVTEGRVIYPLIVKPVDNSGARGIYICRNKDEFQVNYERALEFSQSKQVLIERLMEGKEATVFYYLHEGEIYLLGIGDRWMYEQNDSTLKLPVGYTFPSEDTQSYIDCQNETVVNMFRNLDMREGMVFMQCFVENGRYIVYEMGYRLTGSLEHHLMDQQYGFNHLQAIIDYSVGNKVDISPLASVDPKKCCMANVTLLLKKGTICGTPDIEKLHDLPGVVYAFPSYIAGESITDAQVGKLAQVGLRVLLTADTDEQLLERMNKVKEQASFTDDDDNEMLIKDYDYTQLCSGQ